MQPKNTWADTMPPEEINALRHPLPHPPIGSTRRAVDSHVIYSTFPKATELRAPLNEADKPGPRTSERIRVAFALACAFTFGYAIGTALVQWGGL